jgi:hypothetical protein
MSIDELRDERGVFRILAVDHRDTLRLFLEPTAPESVPGELLTGIKSALVHAISAQRRHRPHRAAALERTHGDRSPVASRVRPDCTTDGGVT